MKEPVWCCLFQPSRVVSKPGSSQYTVSLLWWWCNSSRYCTVKASSVRARSGRNRGGGRRWHRNVAKCAPSFPVLAENTAAEWLTKNECSQTRAWLSPPHDPQTAACVQRYTDTFRETMFAQSEQLGDCLQRYSRMKWRISSRLDSPSTT